MTDDERKARNREYQRASRARRALEAGHVADASDARTASTRAMPDAVDESIAAMRWIVPSDAAAVMCARLLAEQVDSLAGDGTRFADCLRVMSALMRMLRNLGGTPIARRQYELQSARLQRASEAAALRSAPNMTKISPRPPKHDRK
jgi:hypothetical protein